MPPFNGIVTMPTVILNAGMSLVPDTTLPVRSRDRLAVIAPMYNEERGAARALTSLLGQSRLPEEVAVSINGCTDGTYDVVAATLAAHGYLRAPGPTGVPLAARLERWRHPAHGIAVFVVVYQAQTAKSESINNLVASGLLRAERILVVDGDTVFHDDFIAVLRDNFYRLRLRRAHGTTRVTIEDVALQSGAVTSYLPAGAGFDQRVISAARSAEYALSGLLRTGQTRRVGESAVWGRSRLYTVVGCGFVARRDAFPMPSDTLTEDHDLTLAGQASTRRVERLTPQAMEERGLRPVVDGVERSPRELFDRDDVVELWHGGTARFVGAALMYTEDPPHLNGYLRQIERWNGGSVQNALKRLAVAQGWRAATANVRFAVLSATLENLLGLLLLLALPVLLAVNLANPSLGVPLRAVGWWLGFDVAGSAALVGAGYWRSVRDLGARGPGAVLTALRRTALTLAPFMLLKYFNPVSYLAAASKAVPAFLRDQAAARRGTYKITLGVPWERPAARRSSFRTAGAAASLTAVLALVFAASYALVPRLDPITAEGWQLVYRSPRIDMSDHDRLPLASIGVPAGGARGRTAAAWTVSAATATATATTAVDGPRRLSGLAELDVRARVDEAPTAPARVPAPLLAGPRTVVPTDLPLPGGAAARAATVAPGRGGTLAASVAHLDLPGGTSVVQPAPTIALSGPAPSRYCPPAFLARPDEPVHHLDGNAADYTPLTSFDRLMLARLAPIAPLVEGAATAYDLPATFLLQVLVNESYLDPLAVGATGDKGLSQMTSDALTMLRGISEDARSPLHNPRLMSQDFNVFDPDFSICGGAAKLAWASRHVGGVGQPEAYALYINPLHGLVDGHVSERHAPSVNAMIATRPLLVRLGNAYAAYRADPLSVAAADRPLLAVSADLRSGALDLAAAYRRSYQIVVRDGIDDRALYQALFARLFPDALASAAGPAKVMASGGALR